jgi:hypothetical protein
VAKTKQITVQVENTPGAAARVARVLGDAKVNLLALVGTGEGTQGTLHIVVDDARKAKKALDKAEFDYTETSVEQVELPNTPGALAKHLEKLASKGTNLSLVYATAAKGSRKATIVLG